MLLQFLPDRYSAILAFGGAFIALIVSFLCMRFLSFILPADHGKAFAVEGIQSKGKPTGAGLLFISVFSVTSLLFLPVSLQNIIMIILIETAMFAGYFDDGAKKPWSEYKKGLLDLLISFLTALTYSVFSSRVIIFPIIGQTLTIPFALYLLLGTILVWTAINVTNCTDGVDGLSSSLTIISLISMLILAQMLGTLNPWSGSIFIMIAVLAAYLWFNTNPSQLLMGDAGSRSLGVFMAVSIMNTRQPFAYLILCLVFILDGSAGIIKISLKRFLGISILKTITTPFHDHLRKKSGWANAQVTVRTSIIHIIICSLYLILAYNFLIG